MAEVGTATSRRTRARESYANQRYRFVTWPRASGRRSLPASPLGGTGDTPYKRLRSPRSSHARGQDRGRRVKTGLGHRPAA